jgi:hypothetical protein
MLRELALRRGHRRTPLIENNRARTGGALINGKQVMSHARNPLVMYCRILSVNLASPGWSPN